jgi:ubiquitin-protein ligase
LHRYCSQLLFHQEYKEVCEQKDNNGCTAQLVGDDFSHWKGTIKGPDGSIYEGGVFVVDIVIPKGYPFEASLFFTFKSFLTHKAQNAIKL